MQIPTRPVDSTHESDVGVSLEIRELLREVPLIDGHNDLPWQYRKREYDFASIDLGADTSALKWATDIPRLRRGGVGAQFWAAFVPPTMSGPEAGTTLLEQIDAVHEMTARYGATFEFATSAIDIERIHRNGKIASLIGIEGGHSIANSLAVLRQAYRLGARYLTLTHVRTTDWADAAGDEPRHRGLSAFGEKVLREMNRLGMLIDLSHVSDDTMRAALDISRAPIIFSHSSARAVCRHLRNVPDDILRLTARNGGIVMACFLPAYVSERARAHSAQVERHKQEMAKVHPPGSAPFDEAMMAWREANASFHEATLSQVADHIDHLRSVAGIEHVGIGSDFDGFFGATDGLEDVSKFPDLLMELRRRDYSMADLRKIAGENFLRVLREAERVASGG